MTSFVFGFHEIDRTKLALAGGKGANLGELAAIPGIQVPEGFCISTKAFRRIIREKPLLNELGERLSLLKPEDRDAIAGLCAEIRSIIEGIAIPGDIAGEIIGHLSVLGENNAFAVRSSATAEDLPGASFAGQHDSYLNISGREAILQHISKCWASLFSERAVLYRLHNGFDHRTVQLAVIVQKMVFPQAAGILFTADPLSSNRKVTSIDAGFGLGEALVSGLVNADSYKVRNGRIIERKISARKTAVYAAEGSTTQERETGPEQQNMQVLGDEQIIRLEGIGRRIEEHFGSPQDIEWCLADDTVYIVQSRPITTLFPVPEAGDRENRVYLSVGHQQMMTDPMKPLGLSLWQLTAGRPMFKAGGRLFVDITQQLASAAARETLLAGMEQHDPLIKDAIMTIIERGDFIQKLPDDTPSAKSSKSLQPLASQAQVTSDPAIVSGLIAGSRAHIEELKQAIRSKSGPELFDFIREDIAQLKKTSFAPESLAVLMTAINASYWINEKMNEWLGEKNAADILSQSVANNISSEMGLALLDVADVIRPYPEMIDYLQHVQDDNFLDGLPELAGGQEARDAIGAWLGKYGMRCSGEIDISRTRWSEKPSALIPMILNNIRNSEPGAGKRKFEEGRQKALQKERELLGRLRQLPDGEEKAAETKRMIGLLRNFIGYREYPKYDVVSRYLAYKQALLREAGQLVQARLIHEEEDIYYLAFEELYDVVCTKKLDYRIIGQRKDEYGFYEKLSPPRVITSDGEIFSAAYKRENLPAGAITGLPVSAGVAEGRARVFLRMEDAALEEGDILVTSFTDPGWTPLFLSIKGLVTEVGGLMTHGAVIAREYGLPAIVGVENATGIIRDGQRIRVNGTDGYIEIL